MSVEVGLAHPCPHLVMEEVVALADDRRSLFLRAPIASANVVRVLANDEVYIPPGGVASQAQITGTLSGPFRIANCDTSVTLTTSTEVASITLPVGEQVTAVAVARAILGSGLQGVTVELIRGHLVLTDASSVGLDSSILISGSGAASIGFSSQRGARGKRVYPGWELVSRVDAISNRHPRFLEPLQGNPTLKATYIAPPSRCPRCSATFIENDAQFDLTGDIILIRDENLLYQAALKILLTRIRTNPFHQFYGSNISSRIGVKAIGAVTTLITEDVQTALQTLQQLQQAQAKFQQVSAKERLFSVSSVRVTPSSEDATVFLLDVVVSNASGAPIALNVVFSVPGVTALAGTNGLSLGLEATGTGQSNFRTPNSLLQ